MWLPAGENPARIDMTRYMRAMMTEAGQARPDQGPGDRRRSARYSQEDGLARCSRELTKIRRNLLGIREMNRLPDALVVVDPKREHIAVKEAQRMGVTTVALIDTDSDPDTVDLPIPGNDDSIRSIELMLASWPTRCWKAGPRCRRNSRRPHRAAAGASAPPPPTGVAAANPRRQPAVVELGLSRESPALSCGCRRPPHRDPSFDLQGADEHECDYRRRGQRTARPHRHADDEVQGRPRESRRRHGQGDPDPPRGGRQVLASDKGARETAEGRIGDLRSTAQTSAPSSNCAASRRRSSRTSISSRWRNDLAKQVALKNPGDRRGLLAQPFVDEPARTVQDRIAEVVGLIRENMRSARFARLDGTAGDYVHHDGTRRRAARRQRRGSADAGLLRDICAHIAALRPGLRDVRRSARRGASTREKAFAKTAGRRDRPPASRRTSSRRSPRASQDLARRERAGRCSRWPTRSSTARRPSANCSRPRSSKWSKFVRYKVGEKG